MNALKPKQQFYARRQVKLCMIITAVFFVISLFFLSGSGSNSLIFMISIAFIANLYRYITVYVTLGEDFILVKSLTLISRGNIYVLFDEIESMEFKPKKVVIRYCNSINKKSKTVKIRLNLMEENDKMPLLEFLSMISENKVNSTV